ncbi:hypothetical protein [Nostoc commune]|uniref:hypothetical protein n=1 Tax=Nostoc commune TaxID=1178 RepID=UPI0018C4CDF8|nr:hypothetical protein [Nostoc commune]MBG1262524.1 hypothetical protein [Nostoc commune BAE]
MSLLIPLSRVLTPECLIGVVCSEAEKAFTSVYILNSKLRVFTDVQKLFGYMQFRCNNQVTRITHIYDYDRLFAIAN